MPDSIIKRYNKAFELAAIMLFSLFLVFGVLVIKGTLTSGYHLVDDHQFLRYQYEIEYENSAIGDIIVRELKRDFSYRYRPLYYVARVLSCYYLDGSLLALSVLKGFEVAAAICFLYYCGQLMGASRRYALLFALISMVGYQSAVWWKLGPQEATGTMLFSIGLFCCLKYLSTNGIRWALGSVLFLLLMSNYKESFVLLLPFVMLYVLYDGSKGENTFSGQLLRDVIKKRFWYLLALGLIFFTVMLLIFLLPGAGRHSSWADMQEAFINARLGDLKWFFRFGGLFAAILLTYWEALKKLWKEILLTLSFLLPQFYLHSGSGITERYILPSAVGFSFFFVVVAPQLPVLSGKRRMVYVLGLLLLLAAHGRVTLREADYFRYRGESVTTMLETVYEMADGNDKKILSCLRPNEEGNLTIDYYLRLRGIDRVYFWTENELLINQVADLFFPWKYKGELKEPQDFADMDIIVMYNQEDRHYVYTPTLDLSDFKKIPCGTLTIYARND